MSILDIAASVITSYKADVSDHKAQIADLKGAQKDLAQTELDAANARNTQLQGWADQLTALGGALTKLKAIGDFVWEGFKLQQQEVRLQTAALGVDLDGLSRSFGGLKTQMELLSFAGKANQSQFQLTQSELQDVAGAVRTLTERGFDGQQAMEAFQTAILTGNTRALRPFGIVMTGMAETMDLTTDATGQYAKKIENMNELLGRAHDLAKGAGDGVGAFGEDADRSAVKLSDAWADMKMSLSDLGLQLVPLVEHLTQIVGLVKDIIGLLPKAPDGSGGAGGDRDWTDTAGSFLKSYANPANLLDVYGDAKSASNAGSPASGNGAFLKNLMDVQSRNWNIQVKRDGQLLADSLKEAAESLGKGIIGVGDVVVDEAKKREQDMRNEAREKAKQLAEEIKNLVTKQLTEAGQGILDLKGSADVGNARINIPNAGGGAASMRSYADALTPQTIDAMAKAAAIANQALVEQLTKDNPPASPGLGLKMGMTPNTPDGGGTSVLGALADPNLASQLNGIDAAWLKLKQDIAFESDAEARTARQTILEKTFGKVDDVHLMAKAFDGLTKASTSALNAWINGSESAGQAFRKAIGGSIEALADQMLIEGLKNEAYALGSLIPGPTFDPAAAAGFAATGAEFIAGAALAAVVAKELGAGAASASSSKSTPAGGGVPTTSASSSSTTPSSGPVIVYGDSFAGNSARQRSVQAQRLVAAALGTTSGSVLS